MYTTEPFDIITKYTKEHNIAFINGLNPFKQSIVKPLFYPYDGHFNTNGHALVAEYMYEYLIEQNITIKQAS